MAGEVKDAQGHTGVWRTVRGHRVFIRDGEELGSAMARSGKFKNLKREDVTKGKMEMERRRLHAQTADMENAHSNNRYKMSSPGYDFWGKRLIEAQDFEREQNKLIESYDKPQEAEYVSGMIDYNAKTREDRYANYGTVDVTKQDKAIESDIHSLFVYQNEKNMGSLRDEPLQQYYDKYGKENVDRVWADMDKKYAVIQGTNMDYEGLRYNELVEKDKYSPEAIDYYRKQVENAWQNHSWDTNKYNQATRKAKEEFERFDSERSSWDNPSKAQLDKLNTEYKDVVDLRDEYEDRVLSQLDKISNPRQAVKEALTNQEFAEADKLISDYGLEDEKEEFIEGLNKGLRKSYNDYLTEKAYDQHLSDEFDWRFGKGTEKEKEIAFNKAQRGMSEEDATEKYEYDLYKRAKENPDSIDPMTKNSTDWDALDKKWSNRYDYDKEQEEFGAEAQVERFKGRKGKDLGINIKDEPNKVNRVGVTAEEYQRAEDKVARLRQEYEVLSREMDNESKDISSQDYRDVRDDADEKWWEWNEAKKKYDDLFKKEGQITRKQSFTSNEVKNIKAEVERYKRRKNK